jgi:Uma2 family endonuclease
MLTPELKTRRWTREEYDDLVAQGVLTPDDKVELIEGEIIPRMPQNVPHRVAQSLAALALRRVFADGYYVAEAAPFAAGDDSEPEPDLAVIPGQPRDLMRTGQHPSRAVLVVEISDTTLAFDRRRKARLYARAGIPEYWIDNLRDRVLEVYRDPDTDPHNPADARYLTHFVRREGETISPLAAPDSEIAVADLLP